jgi:hypothetical protein
MAAVPIVQICKCLMKFQSSLVIETLSREVNLGGEEASGDNLKTKLTPQTPTGIVFPSNC